MVWHVTCRYSFFHIVGRVPFCSSCVSGLGLTLNLVEKGATVASSMVRTVIYGDDGGRDGGGVGGDFSSDELMVPTFVCNLRKKMEGGRR